VVERPQLPVEGVGVLAVRVRRNQVDVTCGGEDLDRVLFGVGVEVTDEEDVCTLLRVSGDGSD
jgi:hypothetical protein